MECALQALHGWWQYDLCDVYIELVKPVIPRPAQEGDNAAEEAAPAAASTSSAAEQQAYKDTLWLCLDVGLKWAPLFQCMPFAAQDKPGLR